MSRESPQLSGTAVRAVHLLLIAFGVLWTAASVQAQGTSDVSWTQTSLTGPVKRLYTPASGALFARTADGLMRSNDGGSSWSPVSLPAVAPVAGMPAGWTRGYVVDPASHEIIYMATAEGVYKTDDDAATWRLILPLDPEVPGFLALAVSPADHRHLYVALRNEKQRRFRLLRSADGGQTWETALNREQSVHVACTWDVALLQAHATDPDRVFLAASCARNAEQAILESSSDRGTTWSEIYRPKLAEPDWLVAGTPTASSPILLALRKDGRGGGSLLAQSHDDGTSWSTVFEHTGGGSASGGGPDVTIAGLAADPTLPDRLLVGLNVRQSPRDLPGQLRLSNDGGSTWTDIAPPDLPRLHDVRFGIDGRWVFAATDGGVWRAPAP